MRVRGSIDDKIRAAIDSGLPRFSRALVDPAEDWDAAGRNFFRISTTAESPEEAADNVRRILAEFEGLEVGPVQSIGFTGVGWQGRYEEIQRRAIEHYVAESFMAMSMEQDRVYRVARGREDDHRRPLTANLEGSYPETILKIAVRTSNGRIRRPGVKLWADEDFIKAAELNFDAVQQWIDELLFQIRN